VECDPRALGSKPELCRQVDVRGYPTWIIGGRRYLGVQSLEELAEASRFDGRAGIRAGS
jgi:hypothetical protein